MCVVSMVTDNWWDRQIIPEYPIATNPQIIIQGVSQEEFQALKKEVEELKKLLLAAKEYDEATGQPNCEKEDNVKVLIDLAERLGVDLKEVFS